jgi:hypothetical protein
MNAFWASENFEAFIVFRSSQPRENNAENSNSERPVFGEQIKPLGACGNDRHRRFASGEPFQDMVEFMVVGQFEDWVRSEAVNADHFVPGPRLESGSCGYLTLPNASYPTESSLVIAGYAH